MAIDWEYVGRQSANLFGRGWQHFPELIYPSISNMSDTYITSLESLTGSATFHLTYEHDDERDFAEELAREHYQDARKNSWVINHYIDIDPPEIDQNPSGKRGWFINVYITQRGLNALNATKNGLIWETNNHSIDFNMTEYFYRLHLKNDSRLPVKFVEVIKNLPQPRFQNLITDMIAFLMAADRAGDIWTQPK